MKKVYTKEKALDVLKSKRVGVKGKQIAKDDLAGSAGIGTLGAVDYLVKVHHFFLV